LRKILENEVIDVIKSLSLKTERWPIYKLGNPDLSNIIMGQSPRSSTYNKEGKGIPFLQGKAEFGEIYPDFKLFCSDPIKVAIKGDILVSVRAPVGDLNISSKKCCIGRGLAAIRNNKVALYNLYLFYLLKLYKRFIESISTGSTFKAIKKSDIENLEIPLPPLPEQKKIAEIILTVDLAEKKLDEVIKKNAILRKGMQQKLLIKGIGNSEFKNSDIGIIPKHWKSIELREVINLKSGNYFKYSEFEENGIKCLKIDNVGFGNITWDSVSYLPKDYVLLYPDLVLRPNDIVIALNRPIINNKLKIGILKREDSPSILYQRVGKLEIINRNVNPRFLYFVISGNQFKKEISKYLIGTDQPYIRTPIFLKIKIALPPLSEQNRIVEMLNKNDQKKELLKLKKENLTNIKKGLMNDLLTGRMQVRVES